MHVRQIYGLVRTHQLVSMQSLQDALRTLYCKQTGNLKITAHAYSLRKLFRHCQQLPVLKLGMFAYYHSCLHTVLVALRNGRRRHQRRHH